MTAFKLPRHRWRTPIIIYLLCLGTYLGVAGRRVIELPKHARYNHYHYTYLADGLLDGRLSLKSDPPHRNDWARVSKLELADGRALRGTFLKQHPDQFKTTQGEIQPITANQIRSRKDVYYVSFPWFPAILMLPFVAIWGIKFNDVVFTCVIAAMNPVLVYLLLSRLTTLKLAVRSEGDNLWLTALFAFGTVHFYASVLGQVWYTAHIVGVALTALYALTALGGLYPGWAGLFLGLGAITRPPILLSFLFLVREILCRHQRKTASTFTHASRDDRLPLMKRLQRVRSNIAWLPSLRAIAWALLPITLIGAAAVTLNILRFDQPFEFGHRYLDVRWTERIQRWGLFNYHYLSRNLAAMLTLLPRLSGDPPYLRLSLHGLSLFVTTPLFATILWPKQRVSVQPSLYLAVLGPLMINLLYQNTGWVQFGYRFSLDFTVYLIALIAVGGWRIGRGFKAWTILSIIINAFGAITFQRLPQFYWDGMFPVP